MKRLLFFTAASICATTVFAASGDKASTDKSADRDTAVVVTDEKADNVKDKQVVKKATPRVKQNAKEEADKTKAQGTKIDLIPDNNPAK